MLIIHREDAWNTIADRGGTEQFSVPVSANVHRDEQCNGCDRICYISHITYLRASHKLHSLLPRSCRWCPASGRWTSWRASRRRGPGAGCRTRSPGSRGSLPLRTPGTQWCRWLCNVNIIDIIDIYRKYYRFYRYCRHAGFRRFLTRPPSPPCK